MAGRELSQHPVIKAFLSELLAYKTEREVYKIEHMSSDAYVSANKETDEGSIERELHACQALIDYLLDTAPHANFRFKRYEKILLHGRLGEIINKWVVPEHYYLQGQYPTLPTQPILLVTNDTIPIRREICRGWTNLKVAKISNRVTFIGPDAFYGCTHLSAIALPDTVTSIKLGAFSGCSSLTSIALPKDVTYIEGFAFSGCTNLTFMSLPNGVRFIGHSAFDRCPRLTMTLASETYKTIHRFINLTSINLPDGVSSIQQSAFFDCFSLTSVTIPDSVTSIEAIAFAGCGQLDSITLPDSVTSIGNAAFADCSKLASFTFSSRVVSIGNDAFYGCSNLHSVAIPDSVTSIGANAFGDCKRLTSITLSGRMTSISAKTFEGCAGLTSIMVPHGVTSIGARAFRGCSKLPSIAIPENVTSIGARAFEGCSELTCITIPNSVVDIGKDVFKNCTRLKVIYVYSEVVYQSLVNDSLPSACIVRIEFDSAHTRISPPAFGYLTDQPVDTLSPLGRHAAARLAIRVHTPRDRPYFFTVTCEYIRTTDMRTSPGYQFANNYLSSAKTYAAMMTLLLCSKRLQNGRGDGVLPALPDEIIIYLLEWLIGNVLRVKATVTESGGSISTNVTTLFLRPSTEKLDPQPINAVLKSAG